MNIQTELTEQHTAHLTVDIDQTTLDSAKRKAATKLSRQVTIPGFRKGKAPYHVMLRMVGEGAILEEAIEVLSNDIYKDVLAESGVKPYGPGEIADFKLGETLQIIFSVPLVPEVDLKDYRAVRLDYAPPAVEDEAVNRALASLQEQNAVVEPSSQPAVLGDRLTVDVNGVFQASDDDAIEDDDDEDTAEHVADDHDHDHDHPSDAEDGGPDLHELSHDMDGEPFMHEHQMQTTLDAEHEPVPGFADQLVGAVSGDVRRFSLTIPDDSEEYEDVAGRTVNFLVVVRKVEKQTLPALNDDFAARVTAEEEKPLTLLELRMRVRENLEQQAQSRYDSDYTSQALDKIVEQASIKYPPVMLEEEIDRFLDNFDNSLRQNGLSLDAYMTIYRRTKEELREQYREMAKRSLSRSLVMGEVLVKERMRVSQADIDGRIDEVVSRFGDVETESIRKLFQEPAMLDSIVNDLMNNRVRERIAAIARGEAPDVSDLPADEDAEDAAADDDTPAAAEADAPAADAPADDSVETSSEDKGESA